MRKKLLSTLLIAALSVGVLTGCGNNATKQSEQSSATQSSAKQTEVASTAEQEEGIENFNPEGYPIVDEEITLKVLVCIRDTDSVTDPEEMPALQRLEELTGIHAEYEFIKKADWNTKLNLILATNEYPDVIFDGGTINDEDYGVRQEIFIPLDDLIQEYMPIFKERLEASPAKEDMMRNFPASNGKTYALPYKIGVDYAIGAHFYINQSWLEELNLEMPKTVEQLTDVLRAFKTKDPNKNGEADEIPYSNALSDTYFKNTLWLFGIPTSCSNGTGAYLYLDENKQVTLAPAQEGFKEWLEWLHLLSKEGLMDAEAISQDRNAYIAKVKAGNVGFFIDYRKTGAFAGSTVHDTHVLWVPDSETTLMNRRTSFATKRVYVSSTNQYVPQTMRWLDAQLEDEMMASIYLGEENADAGGWFYNENGLIEPNSIKAEQMSRLDVNGFIFGPSDYYTKKYYKMDYVTTKLAECQTYLDAGLTQKYTNSYISDSGFTLEEQDYKTRVLTDFNTAVKEFVASSIVDGVTDKSWEDFQKILEDIGINDLLKLYQREIDKMDL